MKQFFLRIIAGVLILVLAIFCLWRSEAAAPLTDIAAGLVATIKDLQASMIGGNASGDIQNGGSAIFPPADTGGNYGNYDPSAPVDVQLRTMIYNGMLNMSESIDLSAIAPTRQALDAAIADVVYSSPELFYVASGYATQTMDGDVVGLKPSYTKTPAEVASMRETYEALLGEIVLGAPAGSDFDKLLYLHDYFVLNYTYDHSNSTENKIRDAYNFFVQKTGVCQAYMLGLIAAAERLGIESIPVTSDAMMHAWNMVKLDGEWYHVDLTWDDNGTLPNSISYRYFLQSNNGIVAIDADRAENKRHRDWVCAEIADDTRFDAAVWHLTHAPIARYENTYYCTVNTTESAVLGYIYSGSDPTAMSELLAIRGDGWRSGLYERYRDCFSGLMVKDGYLYFNSSNAIHRIHVATSSTTEEIYGIEGLFGLQSIYGFCGFEDDAVICCIATAPDDNTSFKARVSLLH